MIIKNTYGYSIIPNPKFINPDFLDTCRGSSLDRQNDKKETTSEEVIVEEKNPDLTEKKVKKEKLIRSMSSRTKSKIKKKLFSFFGLHKRLTFLTLTFVNQVDDATALKLLGKFLDNAKKQDANFEYLWVAERQERNEVFKDNVHFHLISNKYWKIDKYWNYWLKLQEKGGVVPREAGYKPSSAFDVRQISSTNSKGIGSYLTKYVTKNASKFQFMPWNCSKRISMLYTDFYTDWKFVEQLERLEEKNLIEMKRVSLEYCNIILYHINKMTLPFYNRLRQKNLEMWDQKK